MLAGWVQIWEKLLAIQLASLAMVELLSILLRKGLEQGLNAIEADGQVLVKVVIRKQRQFAPEKW